jgi:hypothetical protein
MMQDFSELHAPTGALGSLPAHEQDWVQYRLKDEQVEAFHRDGFLTGVQVLDDHQVTALCAELAGLMETSHPSHELFHEYHSNESSNPDTILFHAWARGGPGRRFTTCCGVRRFWWRRHNCWRGRCGSGTTSSSANRRTTAAWWHGTRITRIGRGRSRWHT